ncbi:unnamed protein product, partial [Discosporangium mesarthrocarpum]
EKKDKEHAARRRILTFARSADVVKLTDEEAEWLLGIDREMAMKEPSVVRAYFPEAKGVLVTAGECGASYDLLGSTGFIPPYDVDAVETTGAGDAFSAGFLFHVLQDKAPGGLLDHLAAVEEALQFASAVGALTCTGEGAIAAQPTAEDVEALMSGRG